MQFVKSPINFGAIAGWQLIIHSAFNSRNGL
jgi:hypothetical protein